MNCNDIFIWHIFWSKWNAKVIAQSPAITTAKLSRGQAQNEVKLDFQVKFDLEVHGRPPPKIIGILTKLFCTYVSNLVILAWTADELSCGQENH